MLTAAWKLGAKLPIDHEQIQRATGVTSAEWDDYWPPVKRFWRVDGSYLVNDTQLQTYTDAAADDAAMTDSERDAIVAAAHEGLRRMEASCQ